MKPRVVVVDASAEIGGAELSLLPVVARLVERAEVIALLPGPGPLAERLAQLGAQVASGFELPRALTAASRQYGMLGGRVLLAGARQQLRTTAALRRIRPDIVYCNGFRAQLGVTLPARLAHARVVWHVRDIVLVGPPARAFGALSRLAATVIANSEATAAQRALGHARAVVVPNGIDLTRFPPRERPPDGPPTIGMAAHLTPMKGHERFLRVFERLRETVPDLRATIAGGAIYDTGGHGDYAARIRERAAAAGCELVAVEHEAMAEWLARLTVFVHCPDEPESFGRALAEALAVGTPVVTDAAGGAAEVIGDAGVVLKPVDEDGLRASIADLLANEAKRLALSRAGVARAHERFDESAYAARSAELVLSAV